MEIGSHSGTSDLQFACSAHTSENMKQKASNNNKPIWAHCGIPRHRKHLISYRQHLMAKAVLDLDQQDFNVGMRFFHYFL
ncbi:hypothetical protein VNO77_44634 [Canavalia gladiata]|uniref:Uncharacterized protein n=1 Tax=Canavalia gladiata TaxID=3824 RepID=A0AAN9JZB5_CANGL